MQKRKELERSQIEGKTDAATVARASQRADVVSYTLMAEVSHFHQQSVRDYNQAVKVFLREQISYYQKVSKSILNRKKNFLLFVNSIYFVTLTLFFFLQIVGHLQSTLDQYGDS